ncbi:endo-beta-1,3-glucanase [Rhodocollybia butyracea]|uniref:Endo-beta-1,3-glucanase n=1 Tax=Rhodocollybia butyracea TaxID=206335 RepID=A0A9P5PZR4_9AGAR|nr:endo-beta-1,3-glucanase [Rhodocollybia butyracea]
MVSQSALALFALFIGSAQAGKRGLAWPFCIDPGVLNNGQGEVVAIYDWETFAPPDSLGGTGGLGFIGTQATMDSSSSPVADLAARQAQQGWATVFSLNEPDINGISPAEAASWYIQWINPLAIKKALPAVTSSANAGQGLSWLSEFISACAGQCFFDYINLHWYGTSFAEFSSYIESAHAKFPNNIMVITEFALNTGTSSDQVDFFASAFPFLDGLSYVLLYFPFVATSPSLLQANDGAAFAMVGAAACLYNNDGSPSAAGNLMF